MDEEEILAALKAHVAREQAARTNNQIPTQSESGPSYVTGISIDQSVAQPVPTPTYAKSFSAYQGSARFKHIASSDDRIRIDQASAEVWARQSTVGQLNPRNPGPLNAIAQTLKKVIQRSLSWYTRSLHVFHASMAQALEIHGHAINSIQDQMTFIQRQEMSFQDQIGSDLKSFHADLISIQDQLVSIQDQLAQLKSELPSTIDHHVRSLKDSLEESRAVADCAIQEQQGPYVQLFHGLSLVVDLGCGRGGFLELLKAAGIAAYGVDSDPVACEAARRKALKVVEGDLFQHLRQLPDRSLDGVFSARVVEYLSLHLQVDLITLCFHKLKPRGLIVIETIHPGSDSPFGRSYRVDPSHFRAVYPEVLKSMLDSNGFQESRVCFLVPAETSPAAVAEQDALSDNTECSRQMLPLAAAERFARPRAYAVIARRR